MNATSKSDIEGFKGEHTTLVTEQKALDMLDDAAARGGQFYMQIAPGKYDHVTMLDSKDAY